jgi:hypothetical protein
MAGPSLRLLSRFVALVYLPGERIMIGPPQCFTGLVRRSVSWRGREDIEWVEVSRTPYAVETIQLYL